MKGVKYSIAVGNQQVELAHCCEICEGQGGYVGLEGWLKCIECDGYGCLITENGLQILALVHDVLLKGRK